MKQLINLSFLLIVLSISDSSCQKNNMRKDYQKSPDANEIRAVSRKIQFSLYCNEDFSNYNQRIQFNVFIRNTNNNNTLWDSMLPLMNVKDIPGLANKIFFEKSIPDSDSSLLRTGFVYSIENVGISWKLDTCGKSTAIKHIDFNFR